MAPRQGTLEIVDQRPRKTMSQIWEPSLSPFRAWSIHIEMQCSVVSVESENGCIVILTIAIRPAKNGQQAKDQLFARLDSQFFFNRRDLVANGLRPCAKLAGHLFVAKFLKE
jgi:hypothetical protein